MLVQVRFSFEKFFTSLTLKSRIFEVCRVLRLRLNQILLYFGLNQILCVNNRGYMLFSWTFLNSVTNRIFILNQLLITIWFLQFLMLNIVEKTLKGSLDLIPSPSPSVKIDILVNFPTNNLNFHWKWRWWDQIQAIFWNLFYFKEFFFSVKILVCCSIFGPIWKNRDWEFGICKTMF